MQCNKMNKNYCFVLNGNVRIKSSNRLCDSLLNAQHGYYNRMQ